MRCLGVSFGTDARPVAGDYKLLVLEGGHYSLIKNDRTGVDRNGCGVLNGFIERIAWNDNVILAEQETCGGENAKSGWMVVNVKKHTAEGPIDAEITMRTRSGGSGDRSMTRRMSWSQAFAVVRRDHFPGHTHDPDASSPPAICGGEYSFTVKEIVLNQDVAIREVERLNALANSKETRYFWSGTRLFADGGSFGREP